MKIWAISRRRAWSWPNFWKYNRFSASVSKNNPVQKKQKSVLLQAIFRNFFNYINFYLGFLIFNFRPLKYWTT